MICIFCDGIKSLIITNSLNTYNISRMKKK